METPHNSTFWSEDTLRWYLSAARQSRYHAELARMIAPHLPKNGTVCDLGCGTGCLSLALLDGHHLPAITALDQDPGALAALREQAGSRSDLTILDQDAMTLPPEQSWDCILLSFFGRITLGDNLNYFLSHCKKTIISIVNEGPKSSFSSTGTSMHRKEYVPRVAEFLAERGLDFQLEHHALEFGQPLTDLEDAGKFVGHYSPPGTPSPDSGELEEQLEKRSDGSYYLPNQKRFGLFIISAQAKE